MCRHCRAEAGDDNDSGEADTVKIMRMAESIRTAGDSILILTGGEPLMRKDFFSVAEKCTDMFSRVALASNGTLINSEIAGQLKKVGIKRVSISLDGANASTHDHFRGRQGCFDDAVNGCRELKNIGLSFQINATITKHNAEQLDDLIQLSLELGADAFHLFALVPVGCGVEIPASQRLEAYETEDVLRFLHSQARKYEGKLHIKATCAPQYYRILHEEGFISDNSLFTGINSLTRGCLAGSRVCFVSSEGNVQPCGYLPLQVGNVQKNSLAKIWLESPLFRELRDPSLLQGTCGKCKYNIICQGCRARAYAATGNYMAADPDCMLNARAVTVESGTE